MRSCPSIRTSHAHAEQPDLQSGRPRRWRPLGLAVALLFPVSAAWAQAVPSQLPPTAEPGREPLQMPQPVAPTGVEPVLVPEGTVSRAPAGAEHLAFTLSAVEISGSTAYTPEALRPLYADLLGTRISVARAFELASAIERRYRSAGYVTTRVLVPEQAIADGVFRIRVIEGFVSDIVLDTQIGPARAAVERLLAPLRGVRPISVAEIERRLLIANDLAGLSVRGTLEPSRSEQGGSTLVVGVTREAREGTASISNRISPYLGSGELGASVSFNAVGRRADRLSLGLRSSLPLGGSASVNGRWDALIADNGTMLGLSASYSRSKPGRELEPLDVRSQVSSGEATLSYPLLRTRLENLRVVGQFEARNVDTDMVGIAYTRDRLRTARLGLSFDRADRWNGVTAGRVMLHRGLDALGATERGDSLASRANGRSDFTKLTLELARVQQLGARTSLLGTLGVQWTPDALLASEEFALGGASFGRAYNEGEISADRGVAASLELRHNPEQSLLPQGLQLFGFLDGGRLSATSEGLPLGTRRSLSSFGLGARAGLRPQLQASIEIAKPLSAEVATEGNKHPRVFATLTAQF